MRRFDELHLQFPFADARMLCYDRLATPLTACDARYCARFGGMLPKVQYVYQESVSVSRQPTTWAEDGLVVNLRVAFIIKSRN